MSVETETTDPRDCRVAPLLAKTGGDCVSPDAEGIPISFGSTFSLSKEKVKKEAVREEAVGTTGRPEPFGCSGDIRYNGVLVRP
jgi:hypothetical protein